MGSIIDIKKERKLITKIEQLSLFNPEGEINSRKKEE